MPLKESKYKIVFMWVSGLAAPSYSNFMRVASNTKHLMDFTVWAPEHIYSPNAIVNLSSSLPPLQTIGATDWETFKIDNRFFLVVANSQKISDLGPSSYSINSTVYELSTLTNSFIRFQEILTHR